jgi:tetratricopeptide (TPR) repeat protein
MIGLSARSNPLPGAVVAETNQTPFIARPSDLEVLQGHWAAARAGTSQTVVLSSPLGGGKRALMGELCRSAVAEAEDDVLLWRVNLLEEEEGLQSLLRIYASLFSGLQRSPAFRGKVEMALNSQIPKQTTRVQGWYQAFIDGLRKAKPKDGGQVQVSLPRDNPLVGLVEIAVGISRKFPTILEIQGIHNSHSVTIAAFIEALNTEATECQLLTVLGMEPITESSKSWIPLPMQDLLERRAESMHPLPLAPWSSADVGKYLQSKGHDSLDPDRITEISDGRPGFMAELVDALEAQGRLDQDLSTFSLADLADSTPDASELESPEGEPKEGRKFATAEDAGRIAHIAALLGVSFPSALVADMGGYDRDSVDDLIDATAGLYKELQFNEQMGTWIYQFNRAILRESILSKHSSDADQETARRVAAFMERFLVPRGFGYITKTLRIYAENGAPQRSAMLRGMALAGDQHQVWPMLHDMIKYWDELQWPDAMRRTVYMNLIERALGSGKPQAAETIWNEAMEWAADKEDRRLEAWLLFAGSRMDYRRQDLYRARDRADDALKLFASLEDKLKQAEVLNHTAMIELADGNPETALERAQTAEETADVAIVKAHTEYIRGMVARRDRTTLPKAIEHFKKANELAGGIGQAQLALEAGLQLGESLLVSGQTKQASEVLARVGQIAQQLKDSVKERAAAALLGQAHASLKNFEAALQFGERALQLTRALKLSQIEPIDLYNLGFFNLMMGKSKEAVSLFRQSKKGADQANPAFQKELLYNLGTALVKENEMAEAEDAFKAAINPATQVKDWRKLSGAQQQLAGIAGKRGDTDIARALLYKAMEAAEQGDLKDERKNIKKKIDALGA